MELFGNLDFFSNAVLAGFVVSGFGAYVVRFKLSLKPSLRYILAALSILVAVLVFWERPLQALAVLTVQAVALSLKRREVIPTWLAIVIAMTPLILVKTHALPLLGVIGLSFVTFRAVDVLLFAHKNDAIHPVDYVTYLFFPLTILAGPMYRWRDFQADLKKDFEDVNLSSWCVGLEALLLGVIQKFAIAQFIWIYGLSQIPANDYSLRGVVLNAFLYSAYLYFDFAGYSNMAVGIGRMFGMHLPINFNNPILAKNPQDFWRRWHISLSEWLRDVVFMPIYKALSKRPSFSKHRFAAQNIGIFATLIAMGIWNGLQWHYVVSGVMFGTYSVVHNRLVLATKQHPKLAARLSTRTADISGRVVTLILAMLALYVFSGRSPV